jgi:deoxyribodipyrimidine photolyase
MQEFSGHRWTSHLSPHLRAGTIGIRTMLAELGKRHVIRAGRRRRPVAMCFLNELIWREFYIAGLA